MDARLLGVTLAMTCLVVSPLAATEKGSAPRRGASTAEVKTAGRGGSREAGQTAGRGTPGRGDAKGRSDERGTPPSKRYPARSTMACCGYLTAFLTRRGGYLGPV